jgi:hypothetical protein
LSTNVKASGGGLFRNVPPATMVAHGFTIDMLVKLSLADSGWN